MRIYFYKYTNNEAIDIVRGLVEPKCEHHFYMAFQHLINSGKMWDLEDSVQNTAVELRNAGYCAFTHRYNKYKR